MRASAGGASSCFYLWYLNLYTFRNIFSACLECHFRSQGGTYKPFVAGCVCLLCLANSESQGILPTTNIGRLSGSISKTEEQAWSREYLQGLFNLLKPGTISWLHTGEEHSAALQTHHCNSSPPQVRHSEARWIGSHQDRQGEVSYSLYTTSNEHEVCDRNLPSLLKAQEENQIPGFAKHLDDSRRHGAADNTTHPYHHFHCCSITEAEKKMLCAQRLWPVGDTVTFKICKDIVKADRTPSQCNKRKVSPLLGPWFRTDILHAR